MAEELVVGLIDRLQQPEHLADRIKLVELQLEGLKQIPAPSTREALVSSAIDFKRIWALAEPIERKAILLRVLPAFRAKVVLLRDRRVKLIPEASHVL
jgi:hypothetical protein